MQIQNDKLLARTPSAFEGESVLGYLLRLSNINGMVGISAILRKSQYKKLLPERFLQRWLIGKIDISFLTGLTGQSQNEIKFRYENQPRLVNRSTYSVYRPKLCPLCMSLDGHIPLHNEYIQQLICPTHHVVLIDKCHMCHLRINWQRKFIDECNCGEPFKNQPLLLADKEFFRLFIEYGLVSNENGIYDDEKVRQSVLIWQNARCLLRPFDSISTDLDFEYVANETLYNSVLNSLLLLTDKNQPNSHIHTLKRYKEKLYPCLVATGLPNFTAGDECTNQAIKKNIVHSPIYYSPLPAHGQISGIVRSHQQDLHIVSNQRLLSANSESIKYCTKRCLEDRLSAQAFLVTTAESVCVSVDLLIDLVDDGWFEGLVLKRKANQPRIFDLYLINKKLEKLKKSTRSVKGFEKKYFITVTDSDALINFGVRLSKLLNSKLICQYENSNNAGLKSFCVSIEVLEDALLHGILQDKLIHIDDAAIALSTKPIFVYLLNQNNLFRNGREIYVPNNKSVSMLALKEFKKKFILLNSVAAANQLCVDEISALLILKDQMPYKRIYSKNGCIFLYENTPDLWIKIKGIIDKNKTNDSFCDL